MLVDEHLGKDMTYSQQGKEASQEGMGPCHSMNTSLNCLGLPLHPPSPYNIQGKDALVLICTVLVQKE